jgi:hypothetical protein
MKEALISPNEIIYFENNAIGVRIAQVESKEQTFPVGDPMYWMGCEDYIEKDIYYLANNGSIQLNPNYEQPNEVKDAPAELI